MSTVRILFIDDDTAFCKIAERRLRKDFEVAFIHSYEECLEKIEELGQYSVVFVDFFMGSYSGLDFLRLLIEHHSTLPCVMITAYDNQEIAAQALELGAVDFLVKDVYGDCLKIVPKIIHRVMETKFLKEEREPLQEAIRKAEKDSHTKDLFIASMSHELKTPLQAIIGLAECLEEEIYGEVSEEQKKVLEKIKLSGLHLKDLINDIMMAVRLKRDQVAYHFSKVNLSELLESVFRIIQQVEARNELVFKKSISQNIYAYVDAAKVQQVIMNLLTNAAKFTKAGTIELLAYEKDECITIRVVDQGIGIAKDKQEQMFAVFAQGENFLQNREKGVGLGLYLVKEIVEGHGGSVSVDSQRGKGATFTVTLPVRKNCPE